MIKKFDEVFVDKTRLGKKIPKEEYKKKGKYIIIDQGKDKIAGFTDNEDGIFTDVPTIIFGDHTRIIKYIDKPFFLGADGVKVLKSKINNANYKYLYYALKAAYIPNTGYNRHFKWLKKVSINYPSFEKQKRIVKLLDNLSEVKNKKNEELKLCDTLIKARFVEMFGDPIINTKDLSLVSLGKLCTLKAGEFTAAKEIHANKDNINRYPCFGGNGVRGYVDNYTHDGNYSLIGRQGALCGNVQLTAGKFRNTEHAILVKPNVQVNYYWLFMLLKLEKLNRFSSGAAQPGLAVKTLNKIFIPIADLNLQNEFASFAQQVDKSKVAIQKSLDETQTLFDSLMQKYFS
ncbi:type I restriction-modification system S subunit [Lactobacillus amylovorus GRL1118]|uniref:restriction endonuclease subunit S n=1 Tax=Lactobacillus amylovorus TaxID=1604 RepID=UPI00020155ED|nr:restriction endonuclease subunit S [Lactobacillus amylovorus]AEA32351.1 type I restriction-modification system S subunit [Lactobacillus amylovorus GRL1118]